MYLQITISFLAGLLAKRFFILLKESRAYETIYFVIALSFLAGFIACPLVFSVLWRLRIIKKKPLPKKSLEESKKTVSGVICKFVLDGGEKMKAERKEMVQHMIDVIWVPGVYEGFDYSTGKYDRKGQESNGVVSKTDCNGKEQEIAKGVLQNNGRTGFRRIGHAQNVKKLGIVDWYNSGKEALKKRSRGLWRIKVGGIEKKDS